MPFTIHPKHWWQYLNPFWWKRKRMIEAFIDYHWAQMGVKEKVEEAVRDAYLYGEGSVEWPPKD